MAAYWIAVYKNIDDKGNLKGYAEKASPSIKKYNGKILVRGGKCETLEGSPSPRTVLIEFPNLKSAINCYYSKEYQSAKKIANMKFERHIQIVEGI